MYMTAWWFQFFRLRISRNGHMQHVRVQALQKISPNRIDQELGCGSKLLKKWAGRSHIVNGLTQGWAEELARFPVKYSTWNTI